MKDQKKIGVLLSYVSEIIKILSSLLYTPVMLRLLGQSEYGLYHLSSSTVAYLSLLSLGFSASYIRFYSRMKARDNAEEEIAKLNGMFMTVFLVISVIAIVCGSVMIANIELVFRNGLRPEEYSKARILMAFLVFNMALSFPNSVFSSIIFAHERFLFQRLISILYNLFTPFLTLPLLLLGYGSVGMVVISSFFAVATFLSNMTYVLFRLHQKFIFRNLNFSLLKDVWYFTFFIFINQLIDQINWNVDNVLLGRFIGTTAVAVYGLGAQINTMYKMLSTSVSSVFVPQINRLIAAPADENEKSVSLLFIRIGRVQFLILSFVLTGFIFFGRKFMVFWGGAGYDKSYYVALWLIIPVTVPLIQNLGIEIQRAKNKHQARSIVYALISVFNVALSIYLIPIFGSVGAACGTGLSLTAGNILFMNWYYDRKIGLDIPSFWKEILKISKGLILPALFGSMILKYAKIERIYEMLLWIAVYSVVFWISMWLFGMNQSEKDMLLQILRIGRKKG